MGNALVQSAVMGIICGLFGAVVGAGAVGKASGKGYESVPLLSGSSSFVTASCLWWLLVARSGPPSVWMGALTGILTALLAHYGTFYFLILHQNIKYWVSGTVSSLGDPPIDLLHDLWGAAVLTLITYFFFGWFTIPAGAVIGAFYALLLKALV